MADAADPLAAVRPLLAECIDSFEKLEILMHLYSVRSGAQTTAAIAQAVSLTSELVAEVLSELLRDDVVRGGDGAGWWFDRDGSSAAMVEALARVYVDDRMEVLKLMTELAIERVRAKAAQRLADAFVIRMKRRKEDPDA